MQPVYIEVVLGEDIAKRQRERKAKSKTGRAQGCLVLGTSEQNVWVNKQKAPCWLPPYLPMKNYVLEMLCSF